MREIKLPKPLLAVQVDAADAGRFESISCEWLADLGVLRAVLVADHEHHRLYARVKANDLAWDCSCGKANCPAIAAAVAGYEAVNLDYDVQTAAADRSGAKLFYRLWTVTGQLMAQVLVGAEPGGDLPVLEPARALGKIQPRFVADQDQAILAHLAASAGQVLDQECIKALSNTGRAYWQDLSGKALRCNKSRSIELRWELLLDGAQQLAPVAPTGHTLIARKPLCLLDSSSQTLAFDPRWSELVSQELAAPIALDQIAERWRQLESLDLPRPFIPREYRNADAAPEVSLQLRHTADLGQATLKFHYGSCVVTAKETHDPVVERCAEIAVLHTRDQDFEAAAIAQLLGSGWRQDATEWQLPGSPAVLARFMLEQLPTLRAMSWAIDLGEGCPRVDFITADALRLETVAGAAYLRCQGQSLNLLDPAAAPVRSGNHLLLCTSEGRVVAIDVELFTDVQLALAQSDELSPARMAALPIAVEFEQSQQPQQLRHLGDLLDSKTTLPTGLQAELRPYQETGFQWLWRLYQAGFGGLLADDMGLGKTIQTLALISKVTGSTPDAEPCLIVAPLSVLGNWRTEIARFAPDLRLTLHHGANRSQQNWSDVDVVLTSYGLLRQEHEQFAAQRWQIVILDEAQAIKNPRSRTTRSARALDARFRLCLSGTPIENHLGELWSLFAFVEPDLLGPVRLFEEQFRKPIEAGNPDRYTALARRIGPFMLRRTREQVLDDLPPLIETEIRIELGDEQRALYESVRAAGLADLQALDPAAGEITRRGNVLKVITRLRQACCSPALLPEDFPLRDAPSAKLQAVGDMLDELLAEQRKILLFSQFRGMLDELRDTLAKKGVDALMLTGDTKNRADVIQKFQQGAAPVFLISLRAGGVGLNLARADTVILLDPWWNPAVEQQAAARAHRMGQKNTVFLYRLIAADTIEDTMQRLKASKRQISDDLSQSVAALDWMDPELLAELLV